MVFNERIIMKKLNVLVVALFAFSAVASPAFRGIVEGYYGRAYSNEGRKSLYELMKSVGMNTYVYGPKDDPYHHHKWRELYPAKEAEDLKATVADAMANGVKFFWAIHLGGNFDGKAEEWQLLFAKLESVYALGVRAFGVFFDDFGDKDPHRHAEIVNRIQKEFVDKKGGMPGLLMCPNVYATDGNNDYSRTIGKELDPRVMIFWTGFKVMSNISQKDVDSITAATGRKPFIWWNWPVNDYNRHQLLMGKAYGITTDDCVGFVLNPMEHCEASKAAVLQVADFLNDCAGYDPDVSFKKAYERLYGDLAESMILFAEYNSEAYPNWEKFHRVEAPEFVGMVDREDWKSVRKELDRIESAVVQLETKLPKRHANLWNEIGCWVKTLKQDVKIARAMLDIREARQERQKAADESIRKGDLRPRPAYGSLGHLFRRLSGDEMVR